MLLEMPIVRTGLLSSQGKFLVHSVNSLSEWMNAAWHVNLKQR